VWSYALRRAGWTDDRQVWTGSCPCQPFSAAGKGAGFADERHLWPAWFHLIEQCRPTTIFGEQVASKDVNPWLDLVQTDLESLGFAVGSIAFPSAGVGAPHIRDRTYFVADTTSERRDRRQDPAGPGRRSSAKAGGAVSGLADSDCSRRQLFEGVSEHSRIQPTVHESPERFCQFGDERTSFERIEPAGPTNGFWRAADWLLCRDEKWRPVRPGAFPLVDGAPSRVGRSQSDWHAPSGAQQGSRVGRLRAYGNAINAEAARAFIEVAMESLP
jgi:DNA (cytosine-5)-methyltransferase 1